MDFENGFSVPAKLRNTSQRKLFGENYMISEAFGVDGRNEDEYGHVFDWEDLTDPIWTEGAYSIAGCIGFEPDCVVLLHEGEAVGFYMGGQAWIDPEHRGHGLGAKMIVSCIAFTGLLPPTRDIGFSAAGFRIHEDALRILNGMAAVIRPSP